MPFKKYRRGRFKRRPNRWQVYGNAASQLWRDVRYLKSIVNVERKYTDVTASTTSSTTPALVLLNALSLGTPSTSRLGQSIKMTAMFVNVFWSINASASTTYTRMIIFRDMQPNAAAPAAGDLLVTTNSVLSPLVIGNGRRFKVIMDVRKNMSINGTEIVKFKRFVKLFFHTKYNSSNNGTIADITTNSLYMLHMSDQATNTPSFSYNIRCRFIDN